MCGRMTLTRSGAEIAEYFALTATVDALTAPDGGPLRPRYNIAPSQQIPTLLLESEAGRTWEIITTETPQPTTFQPRSFAELHR